MKHFQTDYLPASQQLFLLAFGKELFDEVNNVELREIETNIMDVDPDPASPNINERFTEDWIQYSRERDITFLDMLFGVVYEYGLQQCRNHDLYDAKMHQNMIETMIYPDMEETWDKDEKKNNTSYSSFMDSSLELAKQLFGDVLFKKLQKTKMKSFDWDGEDITTSSVLATFPGVKERFEEGWIEYFEERDYTMLSLVLQCVFHYGYQYGIDTEVKPTRERAKQLMDRLKNRNSDKIEFTEEQKESIRKKLLNQK